MNLYAHWKAHISSDWSKIPRHIQSHTFFNRLRIVLIRFESTTWHKLLDSLFLSTISRYAGHTPTYPGRKVIAMLVMHLCT